jgi:hypothetical protein
MHSRWSCKLLRRANYALPMVVQSLHLTNGKGLKALRRRSRAKA